MQRLIPAGERLSAIGHQTFLNPQQPGEFLAIDTWPDMESLQRFMQDPADPPGDIGSMFAGAPDIVVWVESDYDDSYRA